MNIESRNTDDNRIWAVLFLGVSMLVIFAVQHKGSTNYHTAFQQMELREIDHTLAWVAEEAHTVTPPATLRAEMAPFFFAPVPINSADQELLITLPGIGPGMAKRIIDFRKKGPIKNADDFMRIEGIGSKRYGSLQQYITFK